MGKTVQHKVVFILAPKHPRSNSNGYVREHILMAERVLGKLLPPGAEVHHIDGNPGNNSQKNLVICENHSYHSLLHRRERAIKACGHADWLKCRFCGKYDAPENLTIFYDSGSPNKSGYHTVCTSRYLDSRLSIGENDL